MTTTPDFNSSTEKRARFGKVFSTRVEKLVEDLQAMAKTANLEIYEFDDELVKKLFIELAKRFRTTAHRFGIEFEISIDGEPIEQAMIQNDSDKTQTNSQLGINCIHQAFLAQKR